MAAHLWEDVIGGNRVIKHRRSFQQRPGGVHAAEKAAEGGRRAAAEALQLRRVMVVVGIAVG